jgi:hypothetical protein
MMPLAVVTVSPLRKERRDEDEKSWAMVKSEFKD